MDPFRAACCLYFRAGQLARLAKGDAEKARKAIEAGEEAATLIKEALKAGLKVAL